MFEENKKGYEWLGDYRFLKTISKISIILIILLIFIRWIQINSVASLIGNISAFFTHFLIIYLILTNLFALFRLISFKSFMSTQQEKVSAVDIKEVNKDAVGEVDGDVDGEVDEEGDEGPIAEEEQQKISESNEVDADYLAKIEEETNQYFKKREERSENAQKVVIYLSLGLALIFSFAPSVLLVLIGVFFIWCVIEVWYLVDFLWSITEFLKYGVVRLIGFGVILGGYYVYIIIEIFINQAAGSDFGLLSLILSLLMTAYSFTRMSGRFSDWVDLSKKDYSFVKHKFKSDVKKNLRNEEKKYRDMHNILIFLNITALGYMLFVQRLNYIFGLQYGVSLGEIVYYAVTGITIPLMVIILGFRGLFKRD